MRHRLRGGARGRRRARGDKQRTHRARASAAGWLQRARDTPCTTTAATRTTVCVWSLGVARTGNAGITGANGYTQGQRKGGVPVCLTCVFLRARLLLAALSAGHLPSLPPAAATQHEEVNAKVARSIPPPQCPDRVTAWVTAHSSFVAPLTPPGSAHGCAQNHTPHRPQATEPNFCTPLLGDHGSASHPEFMHRRRYACANGELWCSRRPRTA